MGGASAAGCFCEEGLLADAVGDFRQFALVGTDGGEIIWLADDIEGAEGFPDLFVAWVNRSDFGASGYVRTDGDRKRSNASTDGRAHFRRLLVNLQLGNQAALPDSGAYSVGIGPPAGAGSDDSCPLQEDNDLWSPST